VTSRALSPALILAIGCLGGCVYYNGMYNANRLARSAQKAERDGRTFEANNLWGQVATRAESVLVRHPRSKYVNQAMVLQGVALARLGQCPNAIGPLGRTALIDQHSDLAEEAALALGRCELQMGDPGAAEAALARAQASKNSRRQQEARFHRARALRLIGRQEEALQALAGLEGTRVQQERLLAQAGAGRPVQTLALADSVLARNDSTVVWDSVLVALGRTDPLSASKLVDRLRDQPKTSPATLAQRLFEDGTRLASVDSARATQRLLEATRVGAGTESGQRAELHLIRLNLARVRQPAELAPVDSALRRLAPRGSGLASEAEVRQLHSLVGWVRAQSDSIQPGSSEGDLRLFLTAEIARDSLGARQLATGLFRRIAEEWPESPYAPKALLAGQLLDSAWADTARALLTEHYSDSPYLAFVRGEDVPAFRQLEDSLRAFAVAKPVRAEPGAGPTPGETPKHPGSRRRPQEPNETPGARRRVEQ
jgi:hypothetical protein